jgi:hypothetical protein
MAGRVSQSSVTPATARFRRHPALAAALALAVALLIPTGKVAAVDTLDEEISP